MADSHANAQPPDELAHAGASARVKTYVNVAVALAILTAIEVASLYTPGVPNAVLVTALLVMSVLKFFLVVAFFMHLKEDSNIMRALFVGPLIIAILIILALMALFSAYILLPHTVL